MQYGGLGREEGRASVCGGAVVMVTEVWRKRARCPGTRGDSEGGGRGWSMAWGLYSRGQNAR